MIKENNAKIQEITDLIYAKQGLRLVKWVIAVPENSPIQKIKDLNGKRIATELVNVTKQYLKKNNIKAMVEYSWGSTEIKAPEFVDAIVELTETGASLKAHKLRIIDTLLESTTKLIANKKSWQDSWKHKKIENLSILLQGALLAEQMVGLKMNIHKNNLSKILELLPALEKPTISHLSDENWIAIETIINEKSVKKIIPDYIKSDQRTIIDRNLRGSHTIYTYLRDEDLNFSFDKFDLNRYAGPDILKVEIIKQVNGEKIYSAELPDDGIEGITGSFQPDQDLSIKIPNLEEGVYRIELKGNDDIVISEIITTQHLLVFSGNLFLIDNEEYFNDFTPGSKPTNLVTNATIITFKTSHPSGLQKISVDSQFLEINELNRNFKYQNDSGIIGINTPKNDLSIYFDGFIAFAENQYFNPFPDNIIGIKNNTDINSLDYLITEYSPPNNENGWLVKSNTFDLSQLSKDKNDNIRFRLSAPGLNETGSVIKVSKIKITYQKPTVTLRNLPSKVINFIKRLLTKG